MLYVGCGMRSVGESSAPEPALIDPTLPVHSTQRDDSGASMTYWPSYSQITPAARAAYLHWLSTGRRDPSAYAGYVFLYFYGLERRALHDAERDPDILRELPELLDEVQRLLVLYGSSRSFHRYASRFTEYLHVRHELFEPPVMHAPAPGNDGLPLSLRVGIAQYAMEHRPIPASWALAWIRSDPEAPLRTPATRCADEFDRLFQARYEARFGNGLVIPPCKTTIKVAYQTASASFGGRTFSCTTKWPDVCSLTAPRRALYELASTCCDELDGFSRLVGRDPEARGTLAAAAALPKPLLTADKSGVAARLRELVASRLMDRTSALLDSTDLIEAWGECGTERLTRKESVLLAQLLQRLGFGIEPDVRFHGQPLQRASRVAAFRLAPGHPDSPTPAYAAASVLLHLAVAVSAADGDVDRDEQTTMTQHVATSLSLSTAEQVRLAAHVDWLIASPPGLGGIKRRVRGLSAEKRRTIGRFLVQVALADGHVAPGEVRILTRIYTTLKLDPALVHTDVHALATTQSVPADQPVTVRRASPGETGYSIAPPPEDKVRPDTRVSPESAKPSPLDMAAIEAKIEESATISALLADIFSEDNAPAEQVASESSIAGLDGAHGTLLRRLAERTEWSRTDYEMLAAELGLLPDGALETINEVAFETHDEPACEGDDPIRLNAAVLEALLT